MYITYSTPYFGFGVDTGVCRRNACAQVSGSRDAARPTAGLLGGGVAEAAPRRRSSPRFFTFRSLVASSRGRHGRARRRLTSNCVRLGACELAHVPLVGGRALERRQEGGPSAGERSRADETREKVPPRRHPRPQSRWLHVSSKTETPVIPTNLAFPHTQSPRDRQPAGLREERQPRVPGRRRSSCRETR